MSQFVGSSPFDAFGLLVSDDLDLNPSHCFLGDLGHVECVYYVQAGVEDADVPHSVEMTVRAVLPHDVVHGQLQGVFLGRDVLRDLEIPDCRLGEVISIPRSDHFRVCSGELGSGLGDRSVDIEESLRPFDHDADVLTGLMVHECQERVSLRCTSGSVVGIVHACTTGALYGVVIESSDPAHVFGNIFGLSACETSHDGDDECFRKGRPHHPTGEVVNC